MDHNINSFLLKPKLIINCNPQNIKRNANIIWTKLSKPHLYLIEIAWKKKNTIALQQKS